MADFEEGGISWEDFLELISNMIVPSFEGVIAEIVDNSIDSESKEIVIELYGNDWEEFSVLIYDNGRGFESTEKVKTAFDLGGGQKRKKESGQKGTIGLFNIGLKLTPLSRCNRVSVFTDTEKDGFVHRALDQNIVSAKKQYGTTTEMMESNAQKLALKIINGKNDFRTLVLLTEWSKRPGITNLTSRQLDDFGKHLAIYLGIIYEQRLLDENFPIQISVQTSTKKHSVIAKDPFWDDFKPANIEERLSLPPRDKRSIAKHHRYMMECYMEWGTVATTTQPILIDFEGKKHHVYVTGYAIPVRDTHGRIPERYKKNVFSTGINGLQTQLLKAPNTSGIYFYRNGRCICFGPNGDEDSNNGWYTLIGNVESRWSVVRIKIEFPEELDRYIGLAPTKDRVKPPTAFFDKILTPLSEFIEEPRLRRPLGEKPIRFFSRNPNKDSTDLAVSVHVSSGSNKKRITDCKTCDGDIKPWHHIDTICPKSPCTICGKDCDFDDCKYECPHPNCRKIGEHHAKNCPLNCKYCDFPEGAGGHGDEICPKLCAECQQPPSHCECPCEKCKKAKNRCDCCTVCGQPKPCDCDKKSPSKSELTEIPGGVILRLFKGDKNNVDLIEDALEKYL